MNARFANRWGNHEAHEGMFWVLTSARHFIWKPAAL